VLSNNESDISLWSALTQGTVDDVYCIVILIVWG